MNLERIFSLLPYMAREQQIQTLRGYIACTKSREKQIVLEAILKSIVTKQLRFENRMDGRRA